MTEIGKETPTETLRSRESRIVDEVLEEYVLQINQGQRLPQPFPTFLTNPTTLDELQRWAKNGTSYIVAETIARCEIPDETASSILAEALDSNANYLSRQPKYPNMKDVIDPKIRWMRNAARRLRGEDV